MGSRLQLRMLFTFGAAHTHWMKKGVGLRKKHVFVASGLVIVVT